MLVKLRQRRRVLAARALPICVAIVTAFGAPAVAVDRTIGASIAKPSAAGAPWSASETASLARDLGAILAGSSTLRGAHAGAIVAPVAGGGPLFETNADGAFAPASTMKLLTGSVALDRLGANYRFVTTLERVASPDVAAGFILRGGGDPLLHVSDLDDAAAAAASASADGGTIQLSIDVSHVAPAERRPAGWTLDDALAYYAPVINGFPIDENLLHARIVPAAAIGGRPSVMLAPPFVLPATVPACNERPNVPAFTIAATTTARGTPSTLDIALGRCGDVVVIGTIPQGGPESIDVAVPEPEGLIRAAFGAGIERRGLTLAPAPSSYLPIAGVIEEPYRRAAAAAVVWSHAGEPLSDLLADLWEPSDNLVGEMLLREIDVVANARAGTAAGGVAVEGAWLRALGVDPAGLTLVDGSGLSQYDRLTPRALVAVLRHDWLGPNRSIVIDDLPIAGVRGSMRNDMLGTLAEGRVFAKTGSMMHVRGLAGYIATRTHGAVAFALMIDDWMGEDAGMDVLRAAFCSRVARS